MLLQVFTARQTWSRPPFFFVFAARPQLKFLCLRAKAQRKVHYYYCCCSSKQMKPRRLQVTAVHVRNKWVKNLCLPWRKLQESQTEWRKEPTTCRLLTSALMKVGERSSVGAADWFLFWTGLFHRSHWMSHMFLQLWWKVFSWGFKDVENMVGFLFRKSTGNKLILTKLW